MRVYPQFETSEQPEMMVVREETLELDENGDLQTVDDAVCNCPMAGVVTNIDCPVHGGRGK